VCAFNYNSQELMHSCLLYLAVHLHLTLFWISPHFKLATRCRPKGPFDLAFSGGNFEIFVVKDVRVNCFCASLLCTKFTCHVMHRTCVLSSKVNSNKANDHSYNFVCIYDLGRLVTPIFLSMDCFLYRFCTVCKKMKKVYQVEVLIFCKTLHQIPFI